MNKSEDAMAGNGAAMVGSPAIRVACAIIERQGRVLAAQRSEQMSMPLKWEFPGGKLEDGEDPVACLVREVREELGIDVVILRSLTPVTHDYGAWKIELLPFVCAIGEGVISLHEHKDVVWLLPEELPGLDWPEADIPVLREYLSCREPER